MNCTENSLVLNFLGYFHFESKDIFYALVIKIFEHFSNSKLEQLSISHFCCKRSLQQLHNLVSSNSGTLVKLTLENIWFESFYPPLGKLHFPNIEELIITDEHFDSFKFLFSVGRRITWLEKNLDSTLPSLKSENQDSTNFNPSGQIDYEGLMNFIKNTPDLKCYTGSLPIDFKFSSEIRKAFKSLKRMRKMKLAIDFGIEEFIGSECIEALSFYQSQTNEINWKFLNSLQNLVHLELENEFVPNKGFYDFMALDRLESLSIAQCSFSPESCQEFFDFTRSLKRLRFLHVKNEFIHRPILGESIEVLYFDMVEVENINDRYGYPLRPEETASKFLPFGPGVKFLRIMFYDLSIEEYLFDLKINFPNLEKVKANIPLEKDFGYDIIKDRDPLCEEVWKFYW